MDHRGVRADHPQRPAHLGDSCAAALVLYGRERLGRAVRSPAKDTLLSHASAHTGRGSAFGVHQAMDQAGTLALVAAGVRARTSKPPGTAGRSPLIRASSRHRRSNRPEAHSAAPLLWRYISTVGVISLGVAPFPLLALHAQGRRLLTAAQVPLLFAVAMAVDGATGLLVGAYDRTGARVLILVPVAAAAAAVSFRNTPILVWVRVAVWGLVNGILDSTVKAVVTDFVPGATRASAFRWLALSRGTGLFSAGVLLGLAYERSTVVVISVIVTVNAVALIALASVLPALPDR